MCYFIKAVTRLKQNNTLQLQLVCCLSLLLFLSPVRFLHYFYILYIVIIGRWETQELRGTEVDSKLEQARVWWNYFRCHVHPLQALNGYSVLSVFSASATVVLLELWLASLSVFLASLLSIKACSRFTSSSSSFWNKR